MNGRQTIVLIISEDPLVTDWLGQTLATAGYAVTSAASADEAISAAAEAEPEAVLLDLSLRLSGPDGFRRLVGQLKEHCRCQVLGVVGTRHVDDIDPRLGLDDFFLSTARADEVVARLRLRLGQRDGVSGDSVIRQGELSIDAKSYEVFVGGRPIALTFKEYELLRFLATNSERVFSRESLLNRVWGYNYYGGERTVDVHVQRLRSKLEDANHTFIETVRNVGYRFRVGP